MAGRDRDCTPTSLEHRLARGMGVSGAVWNAREPLVVADYDAMADP